MRWDGSHTVRLSVSVCLDQDDSTSLIRWYRFLALGVSSSASALFISRTCEPSCRCAVVLQPARSAAGLHPTPCSPRHFLRNDGINFRDGRQQHPWPGGAECCTSRLPMFVQKLPEGARTASLVNASTQIGAVCDLSNLSRPSGCR